MRYFLIFLTTLIWVGTAPTLSAGPILILDPVSGDILGSAGSTIGWGFTITNDTDYIEFNSASFCEAPVSLPCVNNPASGMFNDFIAAINDTIVGPPGGTDPDTVTEAFDPILQLGIGSYVIDPLANVGDVDVGEIVLNYTITDLDPGDSSASFVGTGTLTANVSVTVVSPEPATGWILVFAFSAMAWRRNLVRTER